MFPRTILLAAVCVAFVPTLRAQTVAERLPACLACHGANGVSASKEVPSLGAMQSDYVLTQLYMFRENRRIAAPMNALAAGLSDDDLRELGDVISKLPAPRPEAENSPAENERGMALVNQYHCNSCHAADLAGQRNIPRVAGQREDYLLKALTAYKDGSRPGYSPAMSEASKEIKSEDIPVLAKFLSRYR